MKMFQKKKKKEKKWKVTLDHFIFCYYVVVFDKEITAIL